MLIDKINKPINIINTIYSGWGGVSAVCAPCARVGYEAVVFDRPPPGAYYSGVTP